MKNLDMNVFEKWWQENFQRQLEGKGLAPDMIEQLKGMSERGWNARYFYEKDELNVTA